MTAMYDGVELPVPAVRAADAAASRVAAQAVEQARADADRPARPDDLDQLRTRAEGP